VLWDMSTAVRSANRAETRRTIDRLDAMGYPKNGVY
jgi:hypothetical protein